MTEYSILNQKLKAAGIAVSPTELHGFLTGLFTGGIRDQQKWHALLYQITNDNHAYPAELMKDLDVMYEDIRIKLSDSDAFKFQLLLPEEYKLSVRAEAVCDWANHFLLGIGLARPKISRMDGRIGEAVMDLHKICQLGYDENEDEAELLATLEDIIEYLRGIAYLFHSHFKSVNDMTDVVENVH
ncbi:YecA family protein [Actinobacillus succinogenes]|uniref:YecA family protein n=1 Tax=Actinobacillus succinogenes (strain ATCC 55618 / DSM 22257 / CCUG 43843 / 130Z) TaxID=339671 RepID=A6VM36_ACTSZ|nr:UPF0149 family protein [Actinobacillus succinogenes]ABR74033.1 yecA family protein [Actinobacillus succinogenes 130Z]PHI39531.1 YecA family protein [Actinobacillus succinogenes]